MSGVAVTSKRNLISEAVPFVFIVLQAYVTKSDLATSESTNTHLRNVQDHRSRIHHDGVHPDHGEDNTLSLCYVFQ